MTDRQQRFTRPETARDLVKDIIKQKVEDVKQAKADAEAQRKKRKSRLPVLLVLLPVLVGLSAWNLVRMKNQPVVFTPTDRVASLKFKIYLAAEAIEAYHSTHGAIPASLRQIGADAPGLTFVPAETTWSLVGRVDSLSITYRRGEPLAPYSTAYQQLQRRKK